MKKIVFLLIFCFTAMSLQAQQTHVENFDDNSLGWTESQLKNRGGTAVIKKGTMIVSSKDNSKGYTSFDTHCYAPIDIKAPFEINSYVSVGDLDDDNWVGIVFNYKDSGNYYAFYFNKEGIEFARYKDNRLVGDIFQNIKWKGKYSVNCKMTLISNGDELTFKVDDIPMMNVRHMPLDYSGFGFYTCGKQKLTADKVEFIQ